MMNNRDGKVVHFELLKVGEYKFIFLFIKLKYYYL